MVGSSKYSCHFGTLPKGSRFPTCQACRVTALAIFYCHTGANLKLPSNNKMIDQSFLEFLVIATWPRQMVCQPGTKLTMPNWLSYLGRDLAEEVFQAKIQVQTQQKRFCCSSSQSTSNQMSTKPTRTLVHCFGRRPGLGT